MSLAPVSYACTGSRSPTRWASPGSPTTRSTGRSCDVREVHPRGPRRRGRRPGGGPAPRCPADRHHAPAHRAAARRRDREHGHLGRRGRPGPDQYPRPRRPGRRGTLRRRRGPDQGERQGGTAVRPRRALPRRPLPQAPAVHPGGEEGPRARPARGDPAAGADHREPAPAARPDPRPGPGTGGAGGPRHGPSRTAHRPGTAADPLGLTATPEVVLLRVRYHALLAGRPRVKRQPGPAEFARGLPQPISMPTIVALIKFARVPASTARTPSWAMSPRRLGAIPPRPPSRMAIEPKLANPVRAKVTTA